MSQNKITSYDVARHAGVSQPTVSRAFAENGNISPATRIRVLEAAKELGYQPNAIARGLTTHSTHIVGVIMGNISSSLFYPAVLDLFAHRLQAIGKQMLFFNTHETRPVDEILPRVMEYRVDALIIASTTPGRELVDMVTRMGIPVTLINRTIPDSGANSVCSDNQSGGRLVAQTLLAAGHQKMAFLAGVEVTSTNTLREKGYKDYLAQHGIHDILVEQGAYSYDSGYEAALKLLDRDDPPDAIFCAADIMALGAMDAARYKLGIRIPDDLSIIGYDDIPMASWASYNLTTIHQSVTDVVDTVLDISINPDDTPMTTGKTVLLPDRFVRRTSARLSD